jgi:hypothetical protein
MQDAVLLTDLSDDDLEGAYSDCWKSEHGFRPRWDCGRDAMIAYLESYAARIDELQAQWAEEIAWLDERESRFEAERLAERQARAEAEEDALLDSLVAFASRRRVHHLPTHRR